VLDCGSTRDPPTPPGVRLAAAVPLPRNPPCVPRPPFEAVAVLMNRRHDYGGHAAPGAAVDAPGTTVVDPVAA
jgi:hypothetical protein